MNKKRDIRVKEQILKHREALRKEAREKKKKEKMEYAARNKRMPYVKSREQYEINELKHQVAMNKKDIEIAKHNLKVLDEMMATIEKEEKEKEERKKKKDEDCGN